jgi:hypothetical protein
MILDLFDGLLILLSLILRGCCTWSIICHLIAKNTFRTQEFHRSRKVTGIRRYVLYMLQEAQLGLCGELVHHPHPFINHYPTGSCRYSLKFAMTHDRPFLSRRLPVKKTCNQQHCCQGQLELWKTISSNTYFSNLSSHMVSSGFQKDMNINTMHRQNIWWNEDSATMEQLKISQVQNIITKKHISEYTCSKGKSKTLGYNHIISGVCKIAYLYL